MILFGFGQTTIVVTVVLFAIWIIVLDTRAGVRHISPSLIEMARSFGATPPSSTARSCSWAALPEILTGIRLGVIRGVKGVVIGQLLVSIVGLGELFELYSRNFLHRGVLGADADPVRLRDPARRERGGARAPGRVFRGRARLSAGSGIQGDQQMDQPAAGTTRYVIAPPPVVALPVAGDERSCSRSAASTASAATTPSTRARWATTRTASRRSSSRSRPTRWCRRAVPLPAGDQGRAPRDRAGGGAGQGRRATSRSSRRWTASTATRSGST